MRLNSLLDQIALSVRNIAHSDEQHEAIVIAILAGDADGAASASGHTWRVWQRCCTASWTKQLPGLSSTARNSGESQ